VKKIATDKRRETLIGGANRLSAAFFSEVEQ
jgi:hypothetical protein